MGCGLGGASERTWGVVVWGPTFWTHSLDTLFGHTFSPLTLYTVSVIGFLASEYSLAI